MKVSQKAIDKAYANSLKEEKCLANLHGDYNRDGYIDIQRSEVSYRTESGKKDYLHREDAKKAINDILEIWINNNCNKHEAFRYWSACIVLKKVIDINLIIGDYNRQGLY